MLKLDSLFIGHRGTRREYDENTIEAFEIALKSGANYIEFDVRKTKDNEIIVFHDKKVDRITYSKGSIVEYNYSEINQIRFRRTNSRIPTLNEVIKLFKNRIGFMIELKNESIRENVMKTVSIHNVLKNCIISCRDLCELEYIKQHYSESSVCYNITKGKGLKLEDFIRQGKKKSLVFKPDLISLHSKRVTQEFIEVCHINGILALSWDFIGYEDPFEVIKGLYKMGIDGVLFDDFRNITRIKSWLEEINKFS